MEYVVAVIHEDALDNTVDSLFYANTFLKIIEWFMYVKSQEEKFLIYKKNFIFLVI
jgi:hypothetical protein